MNFQDADLREVVRQVSHITGKSFVVAPGVEGRITLFIPEQTDTARIDTLVRTAIESQGLQVTDKGQVVYIENGYQDVFEAAYDDNEGTYLVIPLRHARVQNIIPIVERLLPAEGPGVYAAGDNISNAVIIYGPRSVQERIHALVSTLDDQQAEQVSSELFTLKYTDAGKIAPVLADLFKSEGDASGSQPVLRADPMLNAIAVQGPPQIIRQVADMVKKMDVERAQVLIEAIIVEVTGELAREIGVQIAGGDGSVGGARATTSYNPTGSSMLSLGSVLSALSAQGANTVGGGLSVLVGNRDAFSALLQALSTSQYANLLSTPSIMTLDNELAQIVVGQNVPFLTGTYANDSGAENPFTTISRQDIGITLSVLPRIHPDNSIKLQVKQEVSAIAEKNLSGAADILTNKRTLETIVEAQDGEVLVLGGLMQDDTIESQSKVPVLGDIPVIGALFSAQSTGNTKRNLLVFLRPTIIRNGRRTAELTTYQYDNMRDISDHLHSQYSSENLPWRAVIGAPVARHMPPDPGALPRWKNPQP